MKMQGNMTASNVIGNTSIGAGIGDSIDILPWAYSSITQGTWVFQIVTTFWMRGELYNSSNALNDQIDYLFSSSAGVYSFNLSINRYLNRGIMTTYVDGNSISVYDLNTTNGTWILVIPDITLTAGQHTLSLKATGKTGTGYYLGFASFKILRTA